MRNGVNNKRKQEMKAENTNGFDIKRKQIKRKDY